MPERRSSPRDRLLAAINCEAQKKAPLSFMLYKGLQMASRSYTDFIERQLALGLDPYVMLPPRPPTVVNDHYNLHGLPVSYSPEVRIEEWVEAMEGEATPILIKEYKTPAGTLRAEVRKTADWRWGEHVPFFDDYITPRSRKFLVTDAEDLAALRYLLVAPTEEEIAENARVSRPMIALARKHGLLVSGGWGVGADLLGWIFGLENMVYASVDRPDFLKAMLAMIAGWNQRRMDVLLAMDIDLYIKRAWYEICNFWSPRSFREFLFPILKADVDRAHATGAKFGYIVTSKTMPLLEQYIEAGVDVLIGADPLEWDLAKAKEILDGKVCLWGGVNGQLTMEQGSEAEVRMAVCNTMEAMGGRGFILSPVDNVRVDNATSRRNVMALIDAWQKY